jgi:hypothetical protein
MGERLGRSHSWLSLRSPAESDARFPYELVLRRQDGAIRADGDRVVVGESYGVALRLPAGHRGPVARRWVYVILVDGFGRRQLVFPPPGQGDVENLLPPDGRPPAEIVLTGPIVDVGEPLGQDVYVLLASDTKVPDTADLTEEGVRTDGERGTGEHGGGLPVDLLAPVMTRKRGGTALPPVPADWTLRRTVVTSIRAP